MLYGRRGDEYRTFGGVSGALEALEVSGAVEVSFALAKLCKLIDKKIAKVIDFIGKIGGGGGVMFSPLASFPRTAGGTRHAGGISTRLLSSIVTNKILQISWITSLLCLYHRRFFP